jgi:hypothetical protein
MNRMLMRIFGPKRDEVTGDCIMRNFINCTPPQNIIRMMKSRSVRWAGRVARRRGRGMHIGYWWEIQKERHY